MRTLGPRFVRSGSKHLLRLDVAGTCAANVLMNISDLQKLTDWLIDGARSAASPPRMMAETGERMVQAALPLWRAGPFIHTPPPQTFLLTFISQLRPEIARCSPHFSALASPPSTSSAPWSA